MSLKSMPHGPVMNFSKITGYIYIGTNACCQVHFDQKLLKKGVKADLSMEKERIDQAWGVDYFLWLPTKDGAAPTQNQLLIGSQFIDSIIKSKTKIYIHCRNGHGRAPSMAIAYFIYSGKSFEDSFKLIKKKRPEIHLHKNQITALKKFAKAIK
ncbi:hypothetical protein GW933_01815 [Candidatus Falkowbacteria bacterium]|uniref:Uncharacterized protein n=1 Tax=Candidatus Buchananbacteria bacterium CG10_big_fil_rev_8_21_14_0_10_33_19 TaxID=1974525 RepID=A0A2H0W3P9_9BACT|nr:hypothetical protein [Candidatus Falkowbacteria bacterium]PIS05985.1 MAG: hypothetical protein COT80_04430 [Candidatus Buchananbacteria bacterium CG10_big_fil_rev_8_21_14_0_10_33_19]